MGSLVRRGAALPAIRAAIIALLMASQGAAAGAPLEPDTEISEAAMIDSDALFDDDFDSELDTEIRDPLERVNRGIFRGNRFLDRMLFTPVTRGYRWILPEVARRSIRGVFENLGMPGVVVNDLLQGEGRRARVASTRFLVNTTVGLVGLWDPATRFGFDAHQSDFGQTLGKAGVGSGPYLVLPVFGPNTTRDLVGDVVDLAMRPDTWLLPLGSRLVLGSTDGISIKETNLEALSALEASSVDFYAAMRSAFLMNRQAMVDGSNRIVMREASDDLPDAATDGHTDPVSSAPPSAEPAPLP
jgi:phospholipid-binding lipoprotein MlaA